MVKISPSTVAGGILLAFGIILLLSTFSTVRQLIGENISPMSLINLIWIAIMLAIGVYLTSKGASILTSKTE